MSIFHIIHFFCKICFATIIYLVYIRNFCFTDYIFGEEVVMSKLMFNLKKVIFLSGF